MLELGLAVRVEGPSDESGDIMVDCREFPPSPLPAAREVFIGDANMVTKPRMSVTSIGNKILKRQGKSYENQLHVVLNESEANFNRFKVMITIKIRKSSSTEEV
jgi:hypothetical protein